MLGIIDFSLVLLLRVPIVAGVSKFSEYAGKNEAKKGVQHLPQLNASGRAGRLVFKLCHTHG